MSGTLPLRLRTVQYLNQRQNESLTPAEIFEDLRSEYEGEGQFTLHKMKWHLMCIKAVGLIEGLEPFWDDDGEPSYRYRITEAGRRNLAYLK